MKKQNDAAKRKLPTTLVGQPAKVTIHKMPTGVRGLDDILGGGIPEFSFNVIAATPGCGKTTLAHQIVFANATAKKPALYFTVFGEPAIKMLRYQQQFSFFDESKLGKAIRLGVDPTSEPRINELGEGLSSYMTILSEGAEWVKGQETSGIIRKSVINPKSGGLPQ